MIQLIFTLAKYRHIICSVTQRTKERWASQMSQNNKSILVTTLVYLFIFGLAVSPLFEDMNLLRFLLIGFGAIFIISPLCYFYNNEDEE